jgi:hypothetical protein
MAGLTRFSVSLEADLPARFDRIIERAGIPNRSEAIRELIRARRLTLFFATPWVVKSDLSILTAIALTFGSQRECVVILSFADQRNLHRSKLRPTSGRLPTSRHVSQNSQGFLRQGAGKSKVRTGSTCAPLDFLEFEHHAV